MIVFLFINDNRVGILQTINISNTYCSRPNDKYAFLVSLFDDLSGQVFWDSFCDDGNGTYLERN